MTSELDRKMPFSSDAEQAVIGSILIDPSALDTVTGIISSDDFYFEEHRSIYSAMQGMYLKSRNIDVVTLIDQLVQEGVYDKAGGSEYLRLISESVPTSANVRDYARIVQQKAILRSLIDICNEITEKAYTEQDDVYRLLEYAESKIFAIAEQRENKNFVHIRDALMNVYDNLQELATNKEEAQGMKTGFKDLDRVLVGMAKSDLVLVGARPGMGKTSFAMNIAVNVARRADKEVVTFNLEMSKEQLATRILSTEALVDSHCLRSGRISGDDWVRLATSAGYLSTLPLFIDDTASMTVQQMKAKLRRTKNLGLVIIDYLQLMESSSKSDNRVVVISEITRQLKVMAKELNVPVILLSQLSRGVESRTDKRPMLSDLRESGSIEQDADIVLFLYRDAYYNKESQRQNISECIVAKNRHGETGTVELIWDGQYTRFSNPEYNAPPE